MSYEYQLCVYVNVILENGLGSESCQCVYVYIFSGLFYRVSLCAAYVGIVRVLVRLMCAHISVIMMIIVCGVRGVMRIFGV